MSQNENDGRKEGKPLSLRLPPDLEESMAKAEKALGLSKSDIAGLAIEQGLNVLQKRRSTQETITK